MKYILIFLFALITLQVQAQTKIIGSTTTASGDVQGTYPTIYVKPNVINRANLTQTLRDSLLRFRKDTSITVGSGTTNYAALANTFGKYNRVRITCLLPTAGTASVVLPSGADTLKNTEFKVTLYAQDSTGGVLNVVGFNGFGFWFDGTSLNKIEPIIVISNSQTITCKLLYNNSDWVWLTEIAKDWIGNELLELENGITALTGDITASGSGSVTATIPTGTITSAKILDGTVASVDIASQTVDSLDLKNRSITTVKLQDGAVTSLKVLDNSLTGADLTYLTLRAGTTGSASLQLTSGSDKTTLTGGEILYNGRFAVGIGSSKRRLVTSSDASASNGQIPIGNGDDFTTANITAGYAQTVTNGAGSITLLPDTTKVIPYIPSAEISNGTRDGYFKTQTSFGHQFYNGGYTIFNSSLGTTSGSTQLSVSKSGTSSAVLVALTSSLVPYTQINANDGSRSKTVEFNVQGLTSPVYVTSLSTNSQAIATYQVDGQTSLERITNATVTTLNLPEIVGTTPTLNQVAVGYTLYLTINSASTVTITRTGSDTIEVHGAAAAANTVTATTGTIYARKYVATGLNTWTVY